VEQEERKGEEKQGQERTDSERGFAEDVLLFGLLDPGQIEEEGDEVGVADCHGGEEGVSPVTVCGRAELIHYRLVVV
jgi:hypothetical protein